MPPVRSITRSGSRRPSGGRGIDPAADLVGLEPEQWDGIDPETRQSLLISFDTRVKQYVTDFYKISNECGDKHDQCIRQHKIWRYVAIIGTGALACLNFVAAKRSLAAAAYSMIPIIAAIMAFALAVLANLETFADPASRAQAYRELRELYLDEAEEYERAWNVAVMALGDSWQAYANAVELNRRVVGTDKELRRSYKELMKHSK